VLSEVALNRQHPVSDRLILSSEGLDAK